MLDVFWGRRVFRILKAVGASGYFGHIFSSEQHADTRGPRLIGKV